MPLELTSRPPVSGEFVDDIPAGAKRYTAGRGGVFRAGHDLTRLKRTGVYAGTGLAAAATLRHVGRRKFAEHPDRRPSAGRMAAGTILGPYHAAAAGKPGKKLQAVAPYVPLTAAATIGAHRLKKPHMAAMQEAAGRVQHAGSEREMFGHLAEAGGHWRAGLKASLPVTAAAYAGQAVITRHNASRGLYKEQTMAKAQSGPSAKPETVTTAKSMTCLPTNTRYVVQRTVDGRYAGDGTALTYVQVSTRRPKSGSAPTVAAPTSARSGGRTSVAKAAASRFPVPDGGTHGKRIR